MRKPKLLELTEHALSSLQQHFKNDGHIPEIEPKVLDTIILEIADSADDAPKQILG